MRIHSFVIAVTLAAPVFVGAPIASYALGTPPAISVKSQHVKNTGLDVDSATAAKDGYIVMRLANSEGKIVGVAAVKAGENNAIAIPLTQDIAAGSTLIIALHEESDGNAMFDPIDRPAMADGKPVSSSITAQ
jgi:hypothetical protein